MKLLAWTAVLVLPLLPGTARAGDKDELVPHNDAADQNKGDEPQASADGAASADAAAQAKAKEVLQSYLVAVKAKKWADARKFIHPKALADIAAIKKRTGTESHGLATWARAETDAYLTDYKLGDATATGKGAVAIPSTEEEFDVQEKGTEADIKAEYLLIPLAGKWYVADRRKGDGGELFPAQSVGLSYKGYFDGEYVAPPPSEEPAAPPKKHKKKKPKTDDE